MKSVSSSGRVSPSRLVHDAAPHPADLARDALGLLGRGGHVAGVVDGQEAQPGAERGAPGAATSREAVQPAVVDDLRDEPADVRVHAPRAVEEDPLVRRHRRMLAEQVLQHRGAGALGMRALRDLGELQRIAEQDHVARRRAHRQRVGERHLPGLVDHERVDQCPVEVLVREEPRGAGQELGARRRRHELVACRATLVIESPAYSRLGDAARWTS